MQHKFLQPFFILQKSLNHFYKTNEIPCDYDGIMGVPITFMNKYNPEQFEIIGATESEGKGFSNGVWKEESNVAQAMINGKRVYKRIFIRNKRL